MPTTSLRTTIQSLADNFAAAIIDALRSASLEELLAETQRRPRGRQPVASRRAPSGRLARRSPEDIADTLGTVIALLKEKKAGMRAEEIRNALKLDRREVPRVLKAGLSSRTLRSKGHKRATVYTVA